MGIRHAHAVTLFAVMFSGIGLLLMEVRLGGEINVNSQWFQMMVLGSNDVGYATVNSDSNSDSHSHSDSTDERKVMMREGLDYDYFEFDFEFDFKVPPSGLRLLYIHVGKTGGMTLDRVLRSNCKYKTKPYPIQKCFGGLLGEKNEEDELLLSKLTKRTFHIFIPKPKDLIKTYRDFLFLWTVRNPISRVVSSLDMRNPGNDVYGKGEGFWQDVFFRKCGFGTAQDLANALEFLNDNDNDNRTNSTAASATNSTAATATATASATAASSHMIRIPKNEKSKTLMDFDCHKFGRDTLEGHGDKGHAMMNYAYYSRITDSLPNNPNLVLRTEYLWEDLIQTNALLMRRADDSGNDHSSGSNRRNDTTWISNIRNISSHRETHGSEGWNIKSTLTQRGKETFCCYLSDENQIYEDLVRSAVNLSEQQKKESLDSLYRDCGILPLQTTTLKSSPAAGSSEIDYDSTGSGFSWSDWRSRGCPRHAAATT
jgi:hypothetical protein